MEYLSYKSMHRETLFSPRRTLWWVLYAPIRDLSDLKEKQPAHIPRWFFDSCPPFLNAMNRPSRLTTFRKKKKRISFFHISKEVGWRCYDLWRVKREGWQLSSVHRVWIDLGPKKSTVLVKPLNTSLTKTWRGGQKISTCQIWWP